MYLSRFGVKNYKCLGDIDIPLTPIHVLIGENDAGKSSLLEAIEAFCMCGSCPLWDWFPRPWSGFELLNFSTNRAIIEFNSQWDSMPDQNISAPSFECSFSVNFNPLSISDEKIKALQTDKRIYDVKIEQNDYHEHINLKFIDLNTGKAIISLAKKIFFDPTEMAKPAAILPNNRFYLKSNGKGLSVLLDDILGNNPKEFLRLQEIYTHYFPQFSNIILESCQVTESIYVNDILKEEVKIGKALFIRTNRGQRVRAEQISNGAILVLGYLALAFLPKPPHLLLIEEPENGIYPKRLGEIITLLKELVERTEGVRFPQIIMTTHSPYLLSYFQPEEVTFLSRPKDDPSGPVRARPLRDAPHIEDRLCGGQYYLGELWYNLTEEDLFGAE